MIVLTGLTGYAAPDVPPAIREVVREVHGEGAAGSPVPEVAEALHPAHERRRRTATNPKRLRNVMRGLSPPRCASPPIALRLRLRATERRKAAPDAPPAIREVVREAHGEGAAGSPAQEEAEAQHLSEALGC